MVARRSHFRHVVRNDATQVQFAWQTPRTGTCRTMRRTPEQWALVASQRAALRPFEDVFRGAFLPLMFMEATSRHRFDADRAKSRRHGACGKLADVTVSAAATEPEEGLPTTSTRRALLRGTEFASASRPKMDRMVESAVGAYPVTGSSGYMFARHSPRNKKTKHCLSS